MGKVRSALQAIQRGPKVGQQIEQRYAGGLIPDLGRFPYFGGVSFGAGGVDPYLSQLAQDAYETVGAVGAVMAVRLHVFSEITFCWQQSALNGPRTLFGSSELEILETPWEGASTPDLLNVMELDGSLAGNCYLVRERQSVRNGDRLTRLDPTKVMIATEDIGDPLAGQMYGKYLTGYLYSERPGDKPIFFHPDEVVHFRPLPSRVAPQFLGQSWLTSVMPDATADAQMTQYKRNFLANGAVPGLIMAAKESMTVAEMQALKAVVEAQHTGPLSAGKTLYVGSGLDPHMIGMSFDQLRINVVQGAGESRIAAAGGVPATIIGFSEGQQGSTLNAGNYGSARRRFGDGTLRPLWRKACTALQRVLVKPAGVNRLWYDERDVSFLQEDVKDDADIRESYARTYRTLCESGVAPDAAATFTGTGDLSALVGKHTGLLSVQLQLPGVGETTPDEKARDLAEIIQKIYLGVDIVLTAEEARKIVSSAGASLPGGLKTPPKPPALPAA
jgi:phage portal protein BeeE